MFSTSLLRASSLSQITYPCLAKNERMIQSHRSATPFVVWQFKKLVVSFPVFRGDESEDVFDFLDNFKRAATLNGWSNEDLAIGLPLYLKGYASPWFKSMGNVDGETFDRLKALMTEHFASGASAWRIRQPLGQRRQLEKEPVSEYSYSVRMHCARLNFPTSEWTHYFVQGLKPEIREYVILTRKL